MEIDEMAITGRQLLSYLSGLSDDELDLEVGVTDHFGDPVLYRALPSVQVCDTHWKPGADKPTRIIAFEHVYIGDAPD